MPLIKRITMLLVSGLLGVNCTLNGGIIDRMRMMTRLTHDAVHENFGGWKGLAWAVGKDALELAHQLAYEVTEPYAIALGIVSHDPRQAEEEMNRAIKTRNIERLKLLLAVEGVTVNNKGALLRAIKAQWYEGVALLMTHPTVNINGMYRDYGSCTTVLHEACEGGSPAIGALLLARPEIEVNFIDGMGRTPLMRAAFHGHADIVKQLCCRRDIHVDRSNDLKHPEWSLFAHPACYYYTPLMMVACHHWGTIADNEQEEENKRIITQMLVRNTKTPVNALNEAGQTALMMAIEGNKVLIVQELLRHSQIDVDIRNAHGHTALDSARHEGNAAIIEMLERHAQEQDIMVKPAVNE